ncbi:MAG: ThuA domain-containing protein [Alphaproteobacteria bacterium]
MKLLLWIFGGLVSLGVVGALVVANFFGLILVDIDDMPPELPADFQRPAILVFSKTNGFVHEESMPTASRVLKEMAAANGWSHVETKNGAVMNAEQLAKFDVVVWQNTSGRLLSDEQRAAFKKWLEEGGAYVGIHASGGDFIYRWDWYVEHLLGAQFVGHTMNPQFQDAIVNPQENNTGITDHLPAEWLLTEEEWYAFDRNPADTGSTILATLNEGSYQPGGAAMEGVHPIAWAHKMGEGRVVYSGIGHQAHTYEVEEYQEMLRRAIVWAGRLGEGQYGIAEEGTAQGTAKEFVREVQEGAAIAADSILNFTKKAYDTSADLAVDAYEATSEAAEEAYDATAEAVEEGYEAAKEAVSDEEEPQAAGE